MKNFKVLAVLAFVLMLCGCATTISYKVDRPAELDLHGAKTISVLPIQSETVTDGYAFIRYLLSGYSSRRTSEEDKLANFLTNELTNSILNGGYLTVVGSRQVESAIKNSTTIPCDVYLSGYLSNWKSDFQSETRKYDDGTSQDYYRRTASVTFVYQVIDATSNNIISYNKKSISDTSMWTSDYNSVPNGSVLLEKSSKKVIEQIMKELQPYTISKSISLVSAPEKNEEFAYANDCAKKRMYEPAIDTFLRLFEEAGICEAGYNAAAIMISQGSYNEAISLLDKVIAQTADTKLTKKAYTARSSAEDEISFQKKLQMQLDAQRR